HGLAQARDDIRARGADELARVGLAPAEQFMDKFPSDLSGGQKQRAVIARALILNPVLLVADEPVSMLDMSVRAKILELMVALKRDFELTYLYITHDLATARFFCDRIAIMYLGRIVEIGPADAIYADPKHPYTQALLRAIPEPDPARAVARDLPRGEVPDAASPPLGCPFHPRCPRAFEPCGWESRDLRNLLEERWARLAGEARVEEEQARVDEQQLVEVELPGAACGRKAYFDLEHRASAGRQGSFRRHPPARDEERAHEARIAGRDEQAASETPHPVEPLQLAADPFKRSNAVAEPAGVL